MFLWILQMIIISIVLISSLHYIFLFFKKNLTIPKTKDLVNKPVENYKKMLSGNQNNNVASNNMKSELKEYLKNLAPSKINNENKNENKNENENKVNNETKIDDSGEFFQQQGQAQYSSY
jgi:flagellar basal body-associated protein FliL